MRKLLLISCLLILSLTGCGLKSAKINNVKFIGSSPFDNCVSCSYGIFEKSNGEKFKLPVYDEQIHQLIKGTHYNLTYKIKSFSYPNHMVENVLVSSK